MYKFNVQVTAEGGKDSKLRLTQRCYLEGTPCAMITQAKYIDYLLSTPRNYTCTHLAAHLLGVSHDEANRFLRESTFSAN